MTQVTLTQETKERLKALGIESFHGPHVSIPSLVELESPCSIKWMSIEHSLSMGAFSYAVSGFYSCAEIGRYCSIGENVQVGRQDHHTNWLSTSPFQYLNTPLFDVGSDFIGGNDFQDYRSHMLGKTEGMQPKKTKIGHDVWIGHGAFIKAGVTIATGAIVAANAVVVKDVPPYAVVAGNPAVIKKFRISERYIGQLLTAEWWKWAPWQLQTVPFNNLDECVDVLAEMNAAEFPRFEPTVINIGNLEA